MLDIPFIRSHFDVVKKGLLKRNMEDPETLLARLIEQDDRRKKLQYEADEVTSEFNKLSKEIGQLYKQGLSSKAEALKATSVQLKEKAKALQEQHLQIVSDIEEQLLHIPNVPHPSVPAGNSEKDNVVVRSWGEIPTLSPENTRAHWDLGKEFQLFDLELGAKLTGSGFPVYMGQGAQLQRGLIQFFLQKATEHGYLEIIPPLLVNSDSAKATGQLPDKEGQMYHAADDDLYLIPTAEVPITNIYRNKIIPEHALPVKMAGYTPCFRREAGSYGKEVRGLNRIHQFNKVEIVQITTPETSYQSLEEMVTYVESLVKDLELPYRVLQLCSGDLTYTSALTYDIEVFSAAQNRWLEVSSISNFETYQANRLKLRYKDANNKKNYAHTLNGSALALPRIVAALLENNQHGDVIHLPKSIQPYVGLEALTRH